MVGDIGRVFLGEIGHLKWKLFVLEHCFFIYFNHCCFIGAQLGKSLVDKCLSMTWWLRLVGMLICFIFGTYIFCLVLSDRVSQGADECRGCG